MKQSEGKIFLALKLSCVATKEVGVIDVIEHVL